MELRDFAWPAVVVAMSLVIGWCFAVVFMESSGADNGPIQTTRHTIDVPKMPEQGSGTQTV